MDRTRAIITSKTGKMLVLIEKPNLPGKHTHITFPGGGIERGESPENCLVREAKEEIGAAITVGAFIVSDANPIEENSNLLFYAATLNEGEVIRLSEPENFIGYDWVLLRSIPEYAYANGYDMPFGYNALIASLT